MKPSYSSKKPELLAPAGHIESFFASIENGADAVYLGLKQWSARALAANFSLEELSWLIPYAKQRGVAVQVAFNSLITAPELPQTLDTLQGLNDLHPRALIVQDAGLFTLCREQFPDLKLHASTLMTIHNHGGVQALAALGAERVVLARELSFDEIRKIAERASVELEIFVHGALCFSYSGLCLASSFRGGHSGLQGRCVQPCRLRYRQGRSQGYSLSCNDFSALERIPDLMGLGLSAFKIEGRMKDAEYIAQVVRAYRLVMDVKPAEQQQAIREAQQLIAQAPARRLTGGHLDSRLREQVLTPHRSGSSGLWVGTVTAAGKKGFPVQLRHPLQPGDRIRIESDRGKERESFTVSEMRSSRGACLHTADAGTTVWLAKTPQLNPGERLFRVGGKRRSPAHLFSTVRNAVSRPLPYGRFPSSMASIRANWEAPTGSGRAREELFLKLGHYQDLVAGFQSPAQWVLLEASKMNLEKVAGRRMHPAQKKRFIWALPAIILEKDGSYYEKAVGWYQQRGYRDWELNNWGHFSLFDGTRRPRLIAGSRLNLRNEAALATVAAQGCRESVVSMEITMEELRTLGQISVATVPILCVYFWPPLYISRLKPKLQTETPFFSPRNEVHHFVYKDGCSRIFADQPISWLDRLSTFRSLGYRRFMLDLSDGPSPGKKSISRVLSGFKRERSDQPFALFNLERKPVASKRNGKTKP